MQDESTNQNSLFKDLPLEIKHQIFNHLEKKDLANLALTCKEFANIVSQDYLHSIYGQSLNYLNWIKKEITSFNRKSSKLEDKYQITFFHRPPEEGPLITPVEIQVICAALIFNGLSWRQLLEKDLSDERRTTIITSIIMLNITAALLTYFKYLLCKTENFWYQNSLASDQFLNEVRVLIQRFPHFLANSELALQTDQEPLVTDLIKLIQRNREECEDKFRIICAFVNTIPRYRKAPINLDEIHDEKVKSIIIPSIDKYKSEHRSETPLFKI